MQDWRFDDLTRTLGRATSRRQVMKGLLAGVVTAVVGRSIRIPGVAAAAPTCNGVPYDPSTQCCEPAGIQPRYPIANLDLCPNRVPHPGHTPSFNGCGPENGFARYLIPNRIGPLRNVDFTPACNNHDICYDTCNSDKSVCDANFFNDLSAQCAAAYPGTSWYQTYMRTVCISVDARLYYLAVSRTATGRNAYEDAQKQACDCCPPCENCDEPDFTCCNNTCIPACPDGQPPDPTTCQCNICQNQIDGAACDANDTTKLCCHEQCVSNTCPQGKTFSLETCTCQCAAACPDGQLQDPETCQCQDLCANVTCPECQSCDPTSGDCVQAEDNTACGNNQVCCSGVCQDSCSGTCQGMAQGTPCGSAGYCCVNDTTCHNPVDTIGYDNHCCLQYDVWCSALGRCTTGPDCCQAMGQGGYCGSTEHNEPICCGGTDICCTGGYFFPGTSGTCAPDQNSCS